ncbi:vascular endothelial growth factor Ab isoform X2 [Amia ocellicauda]|uniref:vascular endothelial growth factor Ab isoform X2 n=1 Tax=Amia ocellicauda TaxID=2972642 RepID=UPI00346457BB
MNFILTLINLGLAGLLYLSTVKTAHIPKEGERHPNEVIPFLDVYNRSFCQRRELLVDIFQEYPDDIEYIYKPSCVPLMRCAGCCNDESLECVPTETYNVTMLIMKIKPFHFEKPVQVSFTEHSRCECRIKKDVQEKKEKRDHKNYSEWSTQRSNSCPARQWGPKDTSGIKATVSLVQREENACLYRIPTPVNVPANSHNYIASPDSLS